MEKWMKNFSVSGVKGEMSCARCHETVSHLVNGTTLSDLLLAAGGHVCKQNPVDN